MTSFRRTLFGYRKPEVDAAVAARDSHISGLEQQAAVLGEAKVALESQSLITGARDRLPRGRPLLALGDGGRTRADDP